MAAKLAHEWIALNKRLKDVGDPGDNNEKKQKVAILEHHMKSIEFRTWLLSAVPDAETRFDVKKANLLDNLDPRDKFPYLVRPPVLPPRGASWAFPGGNRLLVSVDLNDKSASLIHSKADEARLSDFKRLWRPAPNDDGRSFSESCLFKWDTGLVTLGKVDFRDKSSPESSFGHVLSAAQALYRMRCLFPKLKVERGDGCKCIWGFTLEHALSGGRVSVGEWSATFIFNVADAKGPWKDAFRSDAAALLALLLSTECRHPCGVSAGTVDPALLQDWPSVFEGAKYPVDPVFAGMDPVDDEEIGAIAKAPWKASGKRGRQEKRAKRAPPKKAKTEASASGKEKEAGEGSGSATEVPLCAAISSAMLLYRLRATFTLGNLILLVPTDHPAFKYDLTLITPMAGETLSTDSVWHVEVAHAATGLLVRFGDWRGAATVWLKEPGRSEWETGAAKRDLAQLLEYLCSRKCTFPEDGIVAGSVA
ncbi:WD repeat-containing protein 90 [Klebsormidium nitens]|uniref:WD repeat-containing protein 90 n=1 Tax=Klebsormidium nitens TaxID=105231 RepID=A0A1Y1HN73_KLENI|nr:WD repeat-containing protein 90 [Klebsormidium nitens]|eukprot:GAQ79172.1 WD repeat-containing protein 90 [Klebsormidium nitens]